jgi:hypothetical protein
MGLAQPLEQRSRIALQGLCDSEANGGAELLVWELLALAIDSQVVFHR